MTSPDPDRLRYAQIAGAVARHALGWRLTAEEEAVAVAELAEAAAGRADLLAERAGTALGFGEGRPDAARYRQIAELCIAAGADPALIERWFKVGRERAAAAAAIPYTGLPPGGLLLLIAGFDERGRGPADVLRVVLPRPGGPVPVSARVIAAASQDGRYASLSATSLPHGATSAVGRKSDQLSARSAQHTAGNIRLSMGIDLSEVTLTQSCGPSESPYGGNGA